MCYRSNFWQSYSQRSVVYSCSRYFGPLYRWINAASRSKIVVVGSSNILHLGLVELSSGFFLEVGLSRIIYGLEEGKCLCASLTVLPIIYNLLFKMSPGVSCQVCHSLLYSQWTSAASDCWNGNENDVVGIDTPLITRPWTLVYTYLRLDYCNSLLSGITDSFLGRLQAVQNAAARFVAITRRCEHITPTPLAASAAAHWI